MSCFTSTNLNTTAAVLSSKGVISSEDGVQISQASIPSDKVTILENAMQRQIKRSSLSAIQKAYLALPNLPDDIVETLQSYYDEKDVLTSAFSSADPSIIAAVLSIKGVISKEVESQISLASTRIQKATILVTAIDHQINSQPAAIVETLKLWPDIL